MAEQLNSETIVPPTPLGGEADAGEVPGLGSAVQDDTIPTPVPEQPTGKDDLNAATDRDGVKGFAHPGETKQSSGVGTVEDRGTVAGVGAVDAGDSGTGALGMENSAAQAQRTTEPLSQQGAVTGVDETE